MRSPARAWLAPARDRRGRAARRDGRRRRLRARRRGRSAQRRAPCAGGAAAGASRRSSGSRSASASGATRVDVVARTEDRLLPGPARRARPRRAARRGPPRARPLLLHGRLRRRRRRVGGAQRLTLVDSSAAALALAREHLERQRGGRAGAVRAGRRLRVRARGRRRLRPARSSTRRRSRAPSATWHARRARTRTCCAARCAAPAPRRHRCSSSRARITSGAEKLRQIALRCGARGRAQLRVRASSACAPDHVVSLDHPGGPLPLGFAAERRSRRRRRAIGRRPFVAVPRRRRRHRRASVLIGVARRPERRCSPARLGGAKPARCRCRGSADAIPSRAPRARCVRGSARLSTRTGAAHRRPLARMQADDGSFGGAASDDEERIFATGRLAG